MADLVRDVMTQGVVAVPPDASLVEAAQLMRAQNTGDVLVTARGRVLGVLTDRDITLRAVADGADPLTVSSRSVCTPDPVTVAPDTTVAGAASLMREHVVARLPVVDDGRLVGMVRGADLARALTAGERAAAAPAVSGTAAPDDPARRRITAPGAQRARPPAW